MDEASSSLPLNSNKTHHGSLILKKHSFTDFVLFFSDIFCQTRGVTHVIRCSNPNQRQAEKQRSPFVVFSPQMVSPPLLSLSNSWAHHSLWRPPPRKNTCMHVFSLRCLMLCFYHSDTQTHIESSNRACSSFMALETPFVLNKKKMNPEELTLSSVKLQSKLFPCSALFQQPFLQLLLLLQQHVHLLVVAEGLPHQLCLGHLSMLQLRGGEEREGVTQASEFQHRTGFYMNFHKKLVWKKKIWHLSFM